MAIRGRCDGCAGSAGPRGRDGRVRAIDVRRTVQGIAEPVHEALREPEGADRPEGFRCGFHWAIGRFSGPVAIALIAAALGVVLIAFYRGIRGRQAAN
jgi:hypothetical protein